MLHSITKLAPHIHIVPISEETDTIHVIAFIESKSASCPHCRYTRVIDDLPIQNKAVRIYLNRIEKDTLENISTPQEIPLTKSEKARVGNANKKWEQACHIKELKKQGYSLQKISDIVNIDRRTVKKYVEMTEPPSLKRTKHSKPLDAFQQEVIQWETDGLTIRAMYHKLKEKDYTGTYGALKCYVASIRKKKKADQTLQSDSYYDRKDIRKILWQNDLEDEKKRKIMNEILTEYPKLRPFYVFIISFRQALKDRDSLEFREPILYEKDRQDPLTTHFISRLLSDFPPTLNAINLMKTMAS
ncbi:hypothetical protein GCM10012290_10230 [Halolactibacillus alkaliphilus]|uniref:HTH IS21-type domain-containing protein n=2 Tax=Halolactibacillus alkaliphilus TaxID=442899 RepID=A0A511X3A2_9BACI|nr:hypothetical protein [Halolactibacillus alkaliphilus]GEN57430.1 hypothetical protein HAL01_18940 [Halolactibacillus alkaliphilus]GGN68472.1 hypothetical protein GCM10012290_10230 [Halolactibacillus alkaliphilus]